MKLHLIIPGPPVAKQRPRSGRGRMYTPKETVNYETYVRELWVIAYHNFTPIQGAVRINLYVYLGIPQSASKKRQAQMLSGEIGAAKKPDLDNVEKIICDALQGLAYLDDKQIVEVHSFKAFSDTPRVEIEIVEK